MPTSPFLPVRWGKVGDAATRSSRAISADVLYEDAVISELGKNSRQVRVDLAFVVKDVGEDHIERAGDLPKITASQLNKRQEFVSIQLESRVFQG